MKSAKPKEENNPTHSHTCYAKCASQQKHNVHEVNTSTTPRNTANKVDSKSPAKGRTANSTEYDWTPQATLLHFLNRFLHATTSLTHATRLTHRHQSCLFLHFNSFSAAAHAVASLLLVDNSGNRLSNVSRNVTWKVFNLCCEVLSKGNLRACGGFIAFATLLVARDWSFIRPHQKRQQRRQASCWVWQNLQMDTLEAEKMQGQTKRIPMCAKKHCTPTNIPMLLQHVVTKHCCDSHHTNKQNRNTPLRNATSRNISQTTIPHTPQKHASHIPRTYELNKQPHMWLITTVVFHNPSENRATANTHRKTPQPQPQPQHLCLLAKMQTCSPPNILLQHVNICQMRTLQQTTGGNAHFWSVRIASLVKRSSIKH